MRIVVQCIILFFLFNSVNGQNSSHKTFNVYDENDNLLEHPFSGGMNTPQFSEVDLNNDGLKDLHIFDGSGFVNTTYINTGNSYIYAPEYAKNFPDFTDWISVKDYNGDGISDIFAFRRGEETDEVAVYNGFYDNDVLHFQEIEYNNLVSNSLPYYDMDGEQYNLEISSIINPSFDDIDLDGDLDIVSFLLAEKHLQYYQNMSVENGWGLDSLYFVDIDSCFGGVYEDGGTAELELAETEGDCVMFQLIEDGEIFETNRLHGGYTIFTLDNDGDGDKEVLFGDASFPSMNLLTNGGTTSATHFTEQDTVFPSYDVPVDNTTMPMGFYLDATFDGVKDLVVSSTFSTLFEPAPSYLYQNIGTTNNPTFELIESSWMTKESIDYGKLSHPTFTDYNQDGLMDMVLGSMTIRLDLNQTAASLILYENTGTLTTPEFTLVDLDWLGLSSFGSYWLRPSFGDLDNDGDEDLLVGDVDGKLIYLENDAGAGLPYSFENPVYEYMDINVDFDLGITASPQIIDLDDDGQNDILLGTRLGVIFFFKNQGTDSNPVFNPAPNDAANIQQLGDVSVGIGKNSIPYMIDVDGVKTLYVGSLRGQIWEYNNISGNISGTYNLVTNDWNGNEFNIGEFPSPCFVDIDRNGYLNSFIGNFRGGIISRQTDIWVGDAITAIEDIKIIDLDIYPNPATDEIQFSIPENIESFSIFNAIGQLVQKDNKDINGLASGIYVLEVRGKENTYVGKFIKK